MKRQVRLLNPVEPLQIPYPENFQGEKTDVDEEEFFLTTMPRKLSDEEIDLAKEYIDRLPYRQSLVYTGAVFLDESDSLLNKSHDQLDEIERRNHLSNTRYSPRGGSRSILQRVVKIRQTGYEGNGAYALLSGSSN